MKQLANDIIERTIKARTMKRIEDLTHRVYSFDLQLRPNVVVDETFYDALAINDCSDAMVVWGDGLLTLNFMRSAGSEQEAIRTAQEQVAKAGYTSLVRKFGKLDCGIYNCYIHGTWE